MGNWGFPRGLIARGDTRGRVTRNTVGIVGLGAMGTSIGLALRSAGVSTLGFDVSRAHLREGLALGAIGRELSDLESFDGCAEQVFVAVPPAQVIPVAKRLLQSTGATIIDVTSVKAEIAEAIRHPRFVPSHPLRGTHLTGPTAAKKDLFLGAVWVVCPNDSTSRREVAATEALIKMMGAEPLQMSPKEHDILIATTSHLPHLAASGLVHVLRKRNPLACRLVSGGFLDTTRIARSNPHLWADITMHNRVELSDSIDELIESLARVRVALAKQDSEKVFAFFSDAYRLMENDLPASAGNKKESPRVQVRTPPVSAGHRHRQTITGTLGGAN